ncbi:MAG: thioredoxin family protein [Mycobacterium leprae]
MGVLSEGTARLAVERLESMMGPVVLQSGAPLAQELAGLAPDSLLSVEPGEDDRVALLDGYGRPTGIRFEGVPQGQELNVLLDDIVAVSRGSTALTPLGRMEAQTLPEGLSLWVLSTPACTRCAQAARLAHAIALESKGRLTATVVDVSDRPELITRFGATTVPWFVVEERVSFAGPLPELVLLQRLAGAAED